MPSRVRHLNKAEHNEEFFSSFDLDTTPYHDWAMMALFYSALHYAEAFFAQWDIHCSNHGCREREINNRMSEVYTEYNDLKNDSIEARYLMRRFTAADIRGVIYPNLQVVKEFVLDV